ncbi:hypothetical protein R2325_16380 [Mycobacteroides chelonae]|uniref:VG15 protein n=1 Tax=Mycobacteroides chelonae TaxID=1774 RepID=UPI002DEE2484|nr:hypothetical protein [Mycobacteroides chelonae]MEC4873562.1 hypothetical protein [Mycobacteroides chelonae]
MATPQEQGQMKALEAYIAYRTLLHSEDQEAIAAALALKLYPVWAIQRFTELDVSTPLWVSSALPLVKTAYLQSQRVAAVYAEDIRYATLATEDPLPMVVPDVERLEKLPAHRFSTEFIPSVSRDPNRQPVVRFDEFPLSDVAKSLVINGNYEIKAHMPGPEEDLMYSGLANSTGAGIRQAINGSRNVTRNLVKFDRRIIGYARFTDGNPCWFCAFLASRGGVYKKGSFIESDAKRTAPKNPPEVPEEYSRIAKVHNHCRCTLRPVYSKAQSMDDEAKFYYKQWTDLTESNYGKSGKELIQLFREQYQVYERPAPEVVDVQEELQARVSALLDVGTDEFSPQVQWANSQLSQLA